MKKCRTLGIELKSLNFGYRFSPLEVVDAIAKINKLCCFGDVITFEDLEGNTYEYVNPANRGESCDSISKLDPRPPIIV